MPLQESIELVTGWNLQQLAELVCGDPGCSVCIDRKRLESDHGQITPFLRELKDRTVREVQPNPHSFSIAR